MKKSEIWFFFWFRTFCIFHVNLNIFEEKKIQFFFGGGLCPPPKNSLYSVLHAWDAHIKIPKKNSKRSNLHERCGMSWIERKIIFQICDSWGLWDNVLLVEGWKVDLLQIPHNQLYVWQDWPGKSIPVVYSYTV